MCEAEAMSEARFRHDARGGSRVPIALLGAATAALQTLAVREAMSLAGGNEAILGGLLGVWLVLTAIGSVLGRNRSLRRVLSISNGLIAYGILIPATICAGRASTKLLAFGVLPSLTTSMVAAVGLLAPCCLLAGWNYARLAMPSPAEPDQTAWRTASSRAYLWDTLGSAVAGACLAFCLLDYALPFQIVGLAVATAIAAAGFCFGRVRRIALLVGAALVALIFWRVPLDLYTYRWQTAGQRVVSAMSSSRGALLVTAKDEQTQLLLDREPLLTTPDEAGAEIVVHLPLSFHPNPRSVVILGVAPVGSTALLRRHGVDRIDEVVGDRSIAAVVGELDHTAREARARIIGDDERRWLASSPETYDVVIVHAGQPVSVSNARLFSTEFYRLAHRALRPGGIVAVEMLGHGSYANVEQRRLHSQVAATLRTSFSNLVILPGPSTLYLGSDVALPAPSDIASFIDERLRERRIDRAYVLPAWLQETFSERRIADASGWASLRMPPSTDLHPAVYRTALAAFLSHFDDVGIHVLGMLSLLLLLAPLVWLSPRSRPVPFCVATTGFAGLAVQLVLMLAYQTAVAALYRDVALVSTAFMGATCVGTWWGSRRGEGIRLLVAIDLAQVCVAAGIAACASQLVSWQGLGARVAVLSASVAMGILVGAGFSVASTNLATHPLGSGGTLYAIDLFGSSFAALVTYNLAVPALGIRGTVLAVGVVKSLSAAALLLPKPTRDFAPSRLRLPGPAFALLVAVTLGIINETQKKLYTMTVSRTYSLLVLAVLGVMLGLAFEPRWLHERIADAERRLVETARTIGLSPLRLVYFLPLVALGALPLARCYFRIPYVFCHACPRPCTFGLMRPYLVPAACIANLHDRRFCEQVCPVGLAQRSCEHARTEPCKKLGAVGVGLRLAVTAAVAALYPLVTWSRGAGIDQAGGVFAYFYSGRYGSSVWVLAVSGVLLLLSFAIRRPFCDALCPIGAVADLTGRMEKRWLISNEPGTENGGSGEGKSDI